MNRKHELRFVLYEILLRSGYAKAASFLLAAEEEAAFRSSPASSKLHLPLPQTIDEWVHALSVGPSASSSTPSAPFLTINNNSKPTGNSPRSKSCFALRSGSKSSQVCAGLLPNPFKPDLCARCQRPKAAHPPVEEAAPAASASSSSSLTTLQVNAPKAEPVVQPPPKLPTSPRSSSFPSFSVSSSASSSSSSSSSSFATFPQRLAPTTSTRIKNLSMIWEAPTSSSAHPVTTTSSSSSSSSSSSAKSNSKRKRIIWCPAADCVVPLSVDESAVDVVQCFHCDALVCVKHEEVRRRKATKEEKEAEANEEEPEKTHEEEKADRKFCCVGEERAWRETNTTTKPCPGCNATMENNGGCRHMTCSGCGHEFFWCCLRAYRDRDEARAHMRECH